MPRSPHADDVHTTDVDAMFVEYRRTHDRELRNRLVVIHLPLADRCARRYVRRGEPLSDLTQVARMALVRAVERFDPARGSAFEAFAVPTITGELRHHFRDNCWAVGVPRSAKELRSRVQRASEELAQHLGRQPTLDELAEALNIDPETVASTIDSNQCYRTTSLEPSGDDQVGMATRLPGPDDPAAEAAERVRATRSLQALDERLRHVIVWRFYEGCSQREIGDRLGVGQVQVSRLLAKALAQLRRQAGVSAA
jgi:RNA polymerase sigma-B factor